MKATIALSNLPGFTGYYGSRFEEVDSYPIELDIDYINDERILLGKEIIDIDNDDLIYDWNLYFETLTKKYCDFIQERFKEEFNFDCEIEYKELISPREYNFMNDRCKCSITFDTIALWRLLSTYKEEIIQEFADQFTSRPGFHSFFSPNVYYWLEQYTVGTLDDTNLGIGLWCALNAIVLIDTSDPLKRQLGHLDDEFENFIDGQIWPECTNCDELINR